MEDLYRTFFVVVFVAQFCFLALFFFVYLQNGVIERLKRIISQTFPEIDTLGFGNCSVAVLLLFTHFFGSSLFCPGLVYHDRQ